MTKKQKVSSLETSRKKKNWDRCQYILSLSLPSLAMGKQKVHIYVVHTMYLPSLDFILHITWNMRPQLLHMVWDTAEWSRHMSTQGGYSPAPSSEERIKWSQVYWELFPV